VIFLKKEVCCERWSGNRPRIAVWNLEKCNGSPQRITAQMLGPFGTTDREEPLVEIAHEYRSDIDENIRIGHLLAGKLSGESQRLFKNRILRHIYPDKE